MTEINWGPTGKLVYERTYSRTKPDGTKETWPETVQRVVDGNLALVPPHRHLPNERERLIQLITDFKILPAGRHLWASGVPGRQYLFNCVSGDTMIHTASGLIPIRELVGRTVDVLSQDATYRPATFYHYGDQEIYTVTFSNGEVVEATAGHEWVTYNSGAFYRHTTTELLGKRVPLNVAPRPEEDEDYRRGVAWGMVYGDGTVTSTKKASLALFGPKVALAAYVEGFGTSTAVHDKRRTDDNVRVNGLPIEWKLTLPELTASRSLWRGFIAGLIATDGHVNGNVTLYSSDRDALAHIAKGAAYAGIPPRRIRMVREFSPFDGSRKPCYALGLTKWALTPQDILREDHLEKIKFPPKASVHTLRVTDVKATGRIERVYCCTEEETHTMTVGSGILTGQCHVAGWGDNITDHFRFTFLRLMEGGGVGANYSNGYLMRYLKVKNRLKVHIVCDPSHPDYEKMRQAGVLSDEYDADWAGAYPIEDSREGWADALVDLLETYYREDVRHENRVYDVSRVRPEGARLRTFGGRASGPLPLAVMLHEVSEVMNRSCGRPLFGMDAMEIDHAIAKCVVSGGNRRSARMSIMAWDDPEIDIFLGCKEEAGKHWTTNISVEINDRFFEALEDSQGSAFRDIAERVLQRIAEGMLRNGEPGIWNSSYANIGEPNPVIATNPCGEIALEPWENCNLGHVNLARFVDSEGNVDYAGIAEAHRLITRFLIRATYGDVNDPKQAEVLARNRRIGVGHLGVASYLAKIGVRYSEAADNPGLAHDLECWAHEVEDEATRYAHQLRIPVPVKMRTVAPTGTIAKLSGDSEGIHPIFGKWFIRRIRLSTVDPEQWQTAVEYAAQGYHVEDCQYAPNTVVIEIPTEDTLIGQVAEIHGREKAEEIVQCAADLTLEDMLKVQRLYQTYWADNAVSCTANIDPEKYTVEDIKQVIREFGPELKGMTIFPEKGMPQAPYERISKDEYESASAKTTADSIDENCASGACPVR